MDGADAYDFQNLLEAVLAGFEAAIVQERELAGSRPKMLEIIRAADKQELVDHLRHQVPGFFNHVLSMKQEAGATARVGRIAQSLDANTLHGLRELLGDLGARTRLAPTPKVSTFLAETFVPERRLQDDAQRHVIGYLSLFAKVTGDKPLADYTRSDVIAWVRTLERLRTTYGKAKGDSVKTVAQLLKESRGKPTLGVTTIQKHITHVKAFFLSGIKHHRFTSRDDIEALFDDIPLSAHVQDVRLRKSWTIPQLGALLASPIWSGTRSRRDDRTHRHEPGPQIHRDAYYWLPVVALWTGARLEELAQLHHEDIATDRSGIPYIRIHDDGDRQVKNKHSIRNVPVHSFLQDIGFLGLFRPGGHGRIWPELQQHGRPPRWGALYSTHFTDYRRACGLYELLRDFHSLRRTFITTLRTRAKVDALTVAALVGHDDSEPEFKKLRQTNDYTDYDCQVLKEAIERLDYGALGLDLGILKRTAEACGPRGSSRIEKIGVPQVAITQ